MNEFDRFVGIPYVTRGRDREGLDCWGLVRLAFAELRGIELPSLVGDYSSHEDRESIAGLIHGELPAWDHISAGSEKTFDGVLMRSGRQACHIGLVVSPGKLLHVEDKRLSVVEPYGAWRLAHRVIGFYRYRPT